MKFVPPCSQRDAPAGCCEAPGHSSEDSAKGVLTDRQNLPSRFTNNKVKSGEGVCLPKGTLLRAGTRGREGLAAQPRAALDSQAKPWGEILESWETAACPSLPVPPAGQGVHHHPPPGWIGGARFQRAFISLRDSAQACAWWIRLGRSSDLSCSHEAQGGWVTCPGSHPS